MFFLAGLIALGIAAVIWRLAYHIGFSEGRLTVPLRLITSLVDHKINCLRERPERVALEMHLLLDLPQQESRRMVDRVVRLDIPPACVPPLSH
jgi:hypothetical protein